LFANFSLIFEKNPACGELEVPTLSVSAKSPSRSGIPLQRALEKLTQIYVFAADAGESGGVAWDATTGCFFGRAAERRTCTGARQTHGAAQHPWRSRSPPGVTQDISLSECAGGTGAGLFLHAQNIFAQQPPKRPLAQNKNGSRFGSLASY
jgi:hypothetical protein